MGVPIDITFHPKWWHKHTGVNFSEEFFEDPEYRISSDIRMRKTLYEKFRKFGLGEKNPEARPIMGSDLIASSYLFSAIMGCKVVFYADNPPEIICMNLNDEDARNYTVPDLGSNSYWKNTIRQFEYLESKYGYVLSHINLQGVQNLAFDIRGSNLFLDYYENPDIAGNLLNACTEIFLKAGGYITSKSGVLSHGVTAITAKVMPNVYLTSNCTVEMISQEHYEEFLLEYDIRLGKAFQPFGIHHCGQTMEHVVKGYAKVEALAFAEVGSGSDIKMVRKALPDVFLNLRYSPIALKNATEDEMMQTLKKMACAAGSKFSISCVGIDDETDDMQVEMFLACASKL